MAWFRASGAGSTATGTIINISTIEDDWANASFDVFKDDVKVDTCTFSNKSAQYTTNIGGTYKFRKRVNAEDYYSEELTVVSNSPDIKYVELNSFNIVAFADGSWNDISRMLDAHYAGKINIADYWTVGDEKSVSVGSFKSYYWSGSTYTYPIIEASNRIVRIVDFNREKLTEDSTKKSAVVLAMDMGSILVMFTRYATNYYDGSGISSMLNNNLYNAISIDLKSLIKSSYIQTTNCYNGSYTNNSYSGYIYLPTYPRYKGEAYPYAENATTASYDWNKQYAFYKQNKSQIPNYSWTASTYTVASNSQYAVTSSGESYKMQDSYANSYFTPHFCI